jgi:hypothetical protein
MCARCCNFFKTIGDLFLTSAFGNRAEVPPRAPIHKNKVGGGATATNNSLSHVVSESETRPRGERVVSLAPRLESDQGESEGGIE